MNSFNDYLELLCNIFNQFKHGKDLDELVISQLNDMISNYDFDFEANYKIDYLLNVLSEKDFYPPEDKRILLSRLHDVDETNNFNQFTKEYFELCDEEEIYD